MYKFLFIFIISFFCISAVAQITENDPVKWKELHTVKVMGSVKAEMLYVTNGDDSTYMLLLENMDKPKNKSKYFSIRFQGKNNTYEKLYTILKSFFLDENKKNKSYYKAFQLGATNVKVQHNRFVGSVGIKISAGYEFITLSEKQVDKLFGAE